MTARVEETSRIVRVAALLLIAGLAAPAAEHLGLLPRAASALSWTLLLSAIPLGPMFGAATRQLPAWQDVSPFTHTPKLPGAELAALPLLGLISIAAALVAAGLAFFRRRNLALPT